MLEYMTENKGWGFFSLPVKLGQSCYMTWTQPELGVSTPTAAIPRLSPPFLSGSRLFDAKLEGDLSNVGGYIDKEHTGKGKHG